MCFDIDSVEVSDSIMAERSPRHGLSVVSDICGIEDVGDEEVCAIADSVHPKVATFLYRRNATERGVSRGEKIFSVMKVDGASQKAKEGVGEDRAWRVRSREGDGDGNHDLGQKESGLLTLEKKAGR